MDADKLPLKLASRIAVAATALLLLGVLIFYKERILFADASFLVFNTLSFGKLEILSSRYGEYITQMVPWVCVKLHMPIKAVLIAYALSFNVFYLWVAYLLAYRYRQFGLAILMSLYYVLFISDSYICASDVSLGIAWLFLFLGVTIHLGMKKVPAWRLLLSFIVLAFLTVTTHFIVIIPTVFMWVYLVLERDNWPFSGKMTALLSVLLALIIGYQFLHVSGSQTYDGNHLNSLADFSFAKIGDLFKTPVISMFLLRCQTNYWLGPIVFIVGLVALLLKRKWLLAIWTLLSCFGYFILIGLTYGTLDGDTLLFHIEGEWASIAILAAAPFVLAFLPQIKPRFAAILLSAIFIVRMVYIEASIHKFTERLQFEKQVMTAMKKKGVTKLALSLDHDTRVRVMLDWAFSYESILTSAMNGEQPTRTFFFYIQNDPRCEDVLIKRDKFFNIWSTIPCYSLNQQYFRLDTTRPYTLMTQEELFKQ